MSTSPPGGKSPESEIFKFVKGSKALEIGLREERNNSFESSEFSDMQKENILFVIETTSLIMYDH